MESEVKNFSDDYIIKFGFSPKGVEIMCGEMEYLAKFCIENNILIHTVEGFVCEGEDRVLDLGYSLFGPDEDIPSWGGKVFGAAGDALKLMKMAGGEGVSVVFRVWLAREKD